MKYRYEYEVKYQEVDDRKRLRLYNLESYLLEVAGRVADDLGFGIQVLHPRGLTWILTRLSVEMAYLPTHNEHLVFETWIEQNIHMLSTRDYRIWLKPSTDSQEPAEWRLIGQCKSVWAVLDLEKREIVNLFDDPIFEGVVDGEVLDIPRVRMTTIPEPTGQREYTIQYSDLDYNRHCNSCNYLRVMTDTYLPDYYGKRVRLDINYQREITGGERLTTLYLKTEDGVQYQQRNSYGETSCSGKIMFNV